MSRIIINADDFGISPEVNQCIAECFLQQLIDRTSIMVNMPYAQEAVEIARKCGFLDTVGLHINLTEGNPLTEKIKSTVFCDASGSFSQGGRTTRSRIYLDKMTKEAVYEEIAAQCQRYLDLGCVLMHADSHQHIHTSLSLVDMILVALQKYGFESVRLSRNIPLHEISGIKRIYKGIINNKIKEYNAKHNKYKMATEFFGNMDDVERFLTNEAQEQDTIEAMTHPGMLREDGMVYDVLNQKCIGEWKDRIFEINQEGI